MKNLIAGWSLTQKCNLKCKHCYSSAGKPSSDELTLEESQLIVDKLDEYGTSAINFGGGECAIRSDFISLVKYIKSKKIKVSYTTNGTVLEKIQNHLDLFDDIGVSIDFPDAKRHNEFRRGRSRIDVYQKAKECIEYLVSNEMDTEIVTCLTRKNADIETLQGIYDLATELNVDHWRLNRFRSNGRGKINESDLKLSPEELRNAYAFLNSKRKDKYDVSTPEPLFRSAFGGRCHFVGDPSGKTSIRIQPNGEVSPSVFLTESGGNIKTESLENIMNSPIFKEIQAKRRPQGKCKECNVYDTCEGGDIGASYLEYGHFDGPDPLCWLDPKSEKTDILVKPSEDWNVHELYLCTLYIPIKENEK